MMEKKIKQRLSNKCPFTLFYKEKMAKYHQTWLFNTKISYICPEFTSLKMSVLGLKNCNILGVFIRINIVTK